MVALVVFSVKLHKIKCVLPSPINTDSAAIKYFIAGRSLPSLPILQGKLSLEGELPPKVSSNTPQAFQMWYRLSSLLPGAPG